MNKFTKRSQFVMSSKQVLKSKLLLKRDCIVINNIVYERLNSKSFRFFFSDDDYDYVVDNKLIKALNVVFKAHKK